MAHSGKSEKYNLTFFKLLRTLKCRSGFTHECKIFGNGLPRFSADLANGVWRE